MTKYKQNVALTWMWGRRFIAIFCLLCYSEGAGRFLQVAMLFPPVPQKLGGGDLMTDFETFSMIIMILTLVIAAYKLGKDSK